jgi:hypothetical protein
MYDFMPDYRRLNKEIAKAQKNLPAEVDMMDTNSEINMQDNQGKDIATVSFSVNKIAEYLIETRFVAFVHQNLENYSRDINAVIGKLNVVFGEWINRKEALKQDHTEPAELSPSLNQIKDEAQHLVDVFESEINERLNRVLSQLNVQHIIDESDQLKQYIRKIEIQKGFQGRLKRTLSRINQRFLHLLYSVEKRLDEQKQKEFSDPLQKALDSLDQIRAFHDLVHPDPGIRDSIPYYYRQLFSGKHLQSQSSSSSRDSEIEQFKKAIEQLGKGVNGAIAITAPAYSGKSFLTEKIVNQLIRGKVHYIRPPQGGAVSRSDLDIAFSSATGQPGTAPVILDSFHQKSIFVFSDLELWWLNHPEGHEVIDYLVDTLLGCDRGHIFVFNCDQYAFVQLKRTTRINEVLLATIPLAPMTKKAIREEILKRHKTGGFDLIYRGHLIDASREDRHFDQLFEQLFQLSRGNIGLALQIWLRSVDRDQNGRYILRKPMAVKFPEISDPVWQNMLQQLALHHALSPGRFRKLYQDMPHEWQSARLNELKTSRLLASPDGPELRLHNAIRPYVQKWLVKSALL